MISSADILSALPHGIVVLGDDYRIRQTNPAADSLIGKPQEELLGRPLSEVLSDVEFERFCAADKEEREAGFTLSLSSPKDGPGADVVVTVAAHQRGLVVIMRRAQRLPASALADPGTESGAKLFASLSHEIRTPLNGVIGMLGLLLAEDLTETQTSYANVARKSADTLLNIINDILDFSKIEAGKLSFEALEFDVRSAVDDVLEVFALAAEHKGVLLTARVDAAVPVRAVGDPGRLRQVLINLVGNAVKFTERGTVSVFVGLDEPDTETSSDDDYMALHFRVEDTGIGVPDEARSKLFQPFSQADGSIRRRFGGTGLGLSISKELVEGMGGKIWFDSEHGAGSVFCFTARLGLGAQATEEQEANVALRGLLVLLVHPDESRLAQMSVELDAWQLRAVTANSPEGALQLLFLREQSDEPVEAVLVSDELPGGGLALAAKIRQSGLKSLPYVLLFHGTDSLPTAAAELGASGVAVALQHPLQMSEVFDCLATFAAFGGGKARPVGPRTRSTHRLLPTVRGTRVLIAEDNPINSRVASLQLSHLGYQADAVANGKEALDALSRVPYDLVLMDCQMPVMDGYEAARQIRSRFGAHPRIVAMTAHALPSDRERCLAAGMDDYLSKPVTMESLSPVLEKWVVRNRRGSRDSAARSALAQLKELESIGGRKGVIDGLLSQFAVDARSRVERLREASAQKQIPVVHREAHAIKGGALSLGRTAVAGACTDLEAITVDTSGDEVECLIDRLVQLLEDVRLTG